jgi:hypothetical protein
VIKLAKPRTNQQKNLQKYLRRIEAAEQHRDNSYKELWARCYKRWKNYVDELIDPQTGKVVTDRSNISIPYTFTQVETILPRLVETLFSARPYMRVLEREPSDLNSAKNMETMLDWQMNERFDIQDIFHHGLKECCIYGTSVAYTGWKWEEKQIIKKQQVPVMDIDPMTGKELTDPETGEPLPIYDDYGEPVTDWQPMKVNEITYDDPELKFIDLGLFYVDPSATDINDARYCGHDDFMTKEELQKLVDQGIYKIDWKKVAKEKNTNKARDFRLSQIGMPTSDDQIEESDEDALYRVTHYWEDDKHAVLINRSYLAMDGDNQFWHKEKPYKKGVYTLVPHEFYGMGIVELLEDLQDELNTERNMRIDFRAFLLRRMFKVRRGARIDKKQLKWRQGGIVEVDEMDDVAEFGVNDNSGSSFANESTIKQDMRDATGGHDVVMGMAGNRETATTTMTKDNNASVRFRLIITSLEKRLLVGVTRLMMQMNQQFIDTPKWIRVTGADGNSVPRQMAPEEIQGEFDLIAAGSSVEPLANKEAYKQRMIELYNITGADPLYQMFPEKRVALLRKVFEAFDLKDVNLLIPTDEEFMAMQQQLMQPPKPPGVPEEMALGGQANTAMMQEQGLPNRIASVPEDWAFQGE